MNVEEMIKALEKVEDKTLEVRCESKENPEKRTQPGCTLKTWQGHDIELRPKVHDRFQDQWIYDIEEWIFCDEDSGEVVILTSNIK